jgi:ribosomal-protein-alanine N-acetyltransferase
MTLDEAFVRQASLATDRLLVRPVREDDAEALFAVRSDPRVSERYGQEPNRSVDDTARWIRNALDGLSRRESMAWALALDDDTVIGECCLWNFGQGHQCAEIGYELHSSYWRRGLMTEALSAVLAYGFGEMKLHRIEANPLASNTASQRLLLRLGFNLEGTLRERIPFRGGFEDQLYYGLLRDEWMRLSEGR